MWPILAIVWFSLPQPERFSFRIVSPIHDQYIIADSSFDITGIGGTGNRQLLVKDADSGNTYCSEARMANLSEGRWRFADCTLGADKTYRVVVRSKVNTDEQLETQIITIHATSNFSLWQQIYNIYSKTVFLLSKQAK
jgi:hypothetical protein